MMGGVENKGQVALVEESKGRLTQARLVPQHCLPHTSPKHQQLCSPSMYEAPGGSLCPHFTGEGAGKHFTDGDMGVYGDGGGLTTAAR